MSFIAAPQSVLISQHTFNLGPASTSTGTLNGTTRIYSMLNFSLACEPENCKTVGCG